tara:strand:- start:155 stop:1144 length:990 start_codon:yes stop_codon:yes gene_type:complete
MTQGIKVTALDDIAQTASDDIMYVVEGTDTISKKVELQNLLYDNMITPAKLSTGAPNWNNDGTLTIGGGVFTGGDAVEVNYWGSGDRNAYIDFHSQGAVGDNGYDYDARLFRYPGVDGKFELSNKGTGPITVDREIADITDDKSIVTKEYVDTQVTVGSLIPIVRPIIAGTHTITGNDQGDKILALGTDIDGAGSGSNSPQTNTFYWQGIRSDTISTGTSVNKIAAIIVEAGIDVFATGQGTYGGFGKEVAYSFDDGSTWKISYSSQHAEIPIGQAPNGLYPFIEHRIDIPEAELSSTTSMHIKVTVQSYNTDNNTRTRTYGKLYAVVY